MLQNMIGGLQGMVDHALVGRFVGFTANAGIGVSWQIFLVVMVFMSSLFTGMAVLVARFVGAGEADKVDRVVYQACLTAVCLGLFVMAPVGYLSAPRLLEFVNATPEVRAEALPFLRIMFTFSIGMLMFFMLSVALRAAGDPKTPLRLGLLLTVLNVVLNVMLIPAMGTAGAATGTVIAGAVVSSVGLWKLFSGTAVIKMTRRMRWTPDWSIIRALFRFGLPTGFQGIAMNIAGVFLIRFIGSLQDSAAAQAAYSVAYTELFSLITWTSVGLMGATSVVAGQNLGACHPERAVRAVQVTARIGLSVAAVVGALFLVVPGWLLSLFGMTDPDVVALGRQLLRYLSLSGLFVTVALAYTGALQGTGDTRSPFYISVISQIVIPLGLCALVQATRGLTPADIWLAIVLGHVTRAILSVVRFRQGKWQQIGVDIERAAVG